MPFDRYKGGFPMANQKKRRSKGALGQVIYILSYAAVGMVSGHAVTRLFDQPESGLSVGKFLLLLGLALIIMYLTIFLQLILHEAGHLLFGLLTGYRFSSFRIGSVMWIKQEDGIHCKRYSVAGTGGQCLLLAPEWTENGIPYVLYNLGGILVNFGLALFFGVLWYLSDPDTIWHTFCMLMAASGLCLGLGNGLPLRVGMVDNDGRNALMLGKSKEALHAFWVQLQVNALQAQGIRMKDMPAEYFAMPSDESLQNNMLAAIATLCCVRLIDEHRFEEALSQITRLLDLENTALEGLQRTLLQSEALYCALLVGADEDRLQSLYSKEVKQFLKAMKTNPSSQRIEHAWLLLHDHNEPAAKALLPLFTKNCAKTPYPQEADSDRELIELTKQKYQSLA